jgi:uncharacterized membrane protein
MNEKLKGLRMSFFAGLLVVVPIAASIAILLGVFNWVTNFLLPERLRDYLSDSRFPVFLFRLVALGVFAGVVTLVGWLTRLVVGRQMVSVSEMAIARVPLLNKIYGFVKEVSHTILGAQKTVFQRVVMLEYPRSGLYMLGFVTSETGGEAQFKTKEDVLNVFIPTTPNPTSGFLVLVPKNQVIDLKMSVGDGMKMVISGGAVVPPFAGTGDGRVGSESVGNGN